MFVTSFALCVGCLGIVVLRLCLMLVDRLVLFVGSCRVRGMCSLLLVLCVARVAWCLLFVVD